MGTLGPNAGGTFADDATVGTIAIVNAVNAAVSDNTYATAVLALGQISHYLKATNFQFAIPLDATIVGITVSIERSTTVATSITDSSVTLVKGGTIGGTDKATGTQWPTSDGVATYGSATDLWGQTWTPADLNASNFGVVIAATAGAAATMQVDQITVTVDYLGSNRAGLSGGMRAVSSGGIARGSDVLT